MGSPAKSDRDHLGNSLVFSGRQRAIRLDRRFGSIHA